MDVTFRPIEGWPRPPTEAPRRSQFKAGYQKTLDLLDFELDRLDASQVVIQLDLAEDQIRFDGKPRAGASPASPGVILSFESRHGSLRYLTDAFDDWRDNLRAIALGLQALRKVDRYGITRRGEQYTGWRQIEAASANSFAAVTVLERHAGLPLDEAGDRRRLYRLAAANAHPDSGGSEDAFNEVQEAWRALGGGS